MRTGIGMLAIAMLVIGAAAAEASQRRASCGARESTAKFGVVSLEIASARSVILAASGSRSFTGNPDLAAIGIKSILHNTLET